jgi:TonB-linked SusC/RagA family outer membrane protein
MEFFNLKHYKFMKKIEPFRGLFISSLRKTLLTMRIAVILMILGILQARASDAYSQKTKLSLNFSQTELVKVLDKIEEESEFFFLYNEKLLDTERKVSISEKDQFINVILDDLFAGTDVKHTIIDRKIILAPEYLTEATQPQQGKITGKVVDLSGAPLPGVNITVKGTTIGANTDVDGKYSILVPNTQAILQFSFIGYAPQEVTVGSQTLINITLAESMLQMDEVVVTALGITKAKREVVYATQDIKSEEFIQARDNNLGSALTGKIAGVSSTQINAGPGSSSRVIIRGNNSLSNVNGSGPNQQPLYVVNGLPINNKNNGASQNTVGLNVDRGDGIGMINPDDIETMTVLKGGAAAALYGSEAANGVILITTKSGKEQKGIGVEFNSVSNVGVPSIYPNYQYEFGQGQNGTKPTTQAQAQASGRLSYGSRMDGSDYIGVDGKTHPYSPVHVKDNIKNFYNPSSDLTNTLSLSAGGKSSTLRFSASDLRSKDQQPNSTYNRQTATLNVMAKMGKNDFIIVKSDVQYSIVNGKNRPTVGYAEMNAAWPVYLIANTMDIRSLSPGYDPTTMKETPWNPVPEAPNSYFIVNRMGNSDVTKRYIASASVQVNILSNLFVIAKGQRDFQNFDYSDFVPVGKNSTPFGAYNTSNGQDEVTNLQTSVNYNTKFLTDFTVSAFVGANSERIFGKSNAVNGRDFVIPDFISLSNLGTITTTGAPVYAANGTISTPAFRSQSSKGTNSIFGSADFGYKRFVYLSFTGRKDWFSVLNPGTNSIFYPSVGTGIILSEIIKMPKQIDLIKLRGNWAQVGSATVGAGTVRQTYSISTTNGYGIATQDVSTFLQNPDLRPLMVTTSEAGFEVKMLDNRLGLDVTYYSKVTTDDIVGINISEASGFSGGNVNIGKTTNKGVEVMLLATPIRNDSDPGGFSWNAVLNYAYNKSRIVELAPTVAEISLGTGIQGVRIVNRPGLAYGTVMAIRPKMTADGVPIYNSTSHFPVGEEVPVGVGNPPHTIGFSNTFNYKNFSLNVLLDGKFGAVAYSNLMFYATRFGLTPATLPGREDGLQLTGVDQNGADFNYTWTPATIQAYYNQIGRGYSALYTYNVDFIKLRRLVLNYNVPLNKLKISGIKSLSVAFVSSNLAILYSGKGVKNAGLDPEFQESTTNAQGTGGVNEPKTRNMGFNIMVKF